MKATIVDVQKDSLTLSDSFFRVAGGGQPCDHGRIFNDSFEAQVVDVVENEAKKVHSIKITRGHPTQGMQVALELDQQRRNVLTRMHTAEHILFKSIKHQYPSLELDKIDLGIDESSIYANVQGLTWEQLLLAEKKANAVIDESLPITETFVPKEKALDFFDIRIKLDRIKEDMVRVVEVQGFDKSACSGTHCKNTSEIGLVFISSLNAAGAGRWQISFTVHKEKIFESASIARQATTLLGCAAPQTLNVVSNLAQEKESYKENFRTLSKKYLATLQSEVHKDVSLYAQVLAGFEPKQLQEAANDILAKDEKSVILFVTEKHAFIFCAPGVRNAKTLLDAVLSRFAGRGGGRDIAAQGGFSGDPNQVLNALKEAI